MLMGSKRVLRGEDSARRLKILIEAKKQQINKQNDQACSKIRAACTFQRVLSRVLKKQRRAAIQAFLLYANKTGSKRPKVTSFFISNDPKTINVRRDTILVPLAVPAVVLYTSGNEQYILIFTELLLALQSNYNQLEWPCRDYNETIDLA